MSSAFLCVLNRAVRTLERTGVAESADLHAARRMQADRADAKARPGGGPDIPGSVAGEHGSGTALALFPVSVTAFQAPILLQIGNKIALPRSQCRIPWR
jgi:hypothetical protein